MHWLDVIITLVLAINIFISLKRGLVKEIFSLIAIFLGIIVASRYYEEIWIFRQIFKNPYVQNIINFILLFLGVAIAVHLVGMLFHKVIKFVGLGLLNRMGGIIFGFVKGVLIIGIVCFFMAKFPFLKVLIDKAPFASALMRFTQNVIFLIWRRPETIIYI